MEMDRRVELVESLKKFCASTRLPPTPLLLFPEEEATNGREGLLRFRWVKRRHLAPVEWVARLLGEPALVPFLSCPLLALPSKFLIPQLSAYGVGQLTSLSQVQVVGWARLNSHTTLSLSPSLSLSSWPFSIQDVVQPLILQVQRPLVSVVSACWTGNALGSGREVSPPWLRAHFMPSPQTVSDASWVSELLWSLFVPFTVYQVRY